MRPAGRRGVVRSPSMQTQSLEPLIADVFREEWGRLVAVAMRMLSDLDRAEEVVQDCWLTAVEKWRRDGLPENPGAWLMTTVRNRALDELRRQQRLRAKHAEIAAETVQAAAPEEASPEIPGDGAIPDERLGLIFTCCHPVLPREGRVALTLRLLGGDCRRGRSPGHSSFPSPRFPRGSFAPSAPLPNVACPTACPTR